MKEQRQILIVDDEPGIRRILEVAFSKSGYKVSTAASAEEALSILSESTVDCVVTDVTMPGMSGYELQGIIAQRWAETPVVLMTAYGTIPQAVQAIRNGAFEYVTKPFDLDQLKRVVAAATSKKTVSPKRKPAGTCAPGFIAVSAAMREIMELAMQVAPSKANVLITGESGVGKEVVAKAIHTYSNRSDKPFVAVSCAALPDSLLESELFGHEKGAFTGADQAKQGRFELANEGTLFLDEIGEIPALTQVKLLRVLQEREFERLGSATPVRVDVRLVTATNRDLSLEVERGTFRLDLLYRLQVVEIHIPPLRERPEDIVPLAEHFAAKFGAENGHMDLGIDDETCHLLASYRWPGNVRELENTIERAVVLCKLEEHLILPSHLPKNFRTAA